MLSMTAECRRVTGTHSFCSHANFIPASSPVEPCCTSPVCPQQYTPHTDLCHAISHICRKYDVDCLHSSCPSIPVLREQTNWETVPAPPPRRAESFLCVAYHLHRRAQKTKKRSNRILRQIVGEQRGRFEAMEKNDENVCHNVSIEREYLQEYEPSDDPAVGEIPLKDSCKLVPKALNGSGIMLCENKFASNKPVFIYSYNPPSPPTISTPTFDISHYNEIQTPTRIECAAEHSQRVESELSSSTLTATYLATEESDISPLPPHCQRISPMNTDSVTTSSPMNTDSVTTSSHQLNTAMTDPSTTYTCNSPVDSSYSDTSSLVDGRNMLLNPSESTEFKVSELQLSEESAETFVPQTPEAVCVSPILCERCSHSQCKIPEEQSFPMHTFSDSQKQSQEGVSDPTTNESSDRARRSSPPSSSDLSLSSLPSDTITMNTGIDSIFTDSDNNENSSSSTGKTALAAVPEKRSMIEATDSAFASPSTSPTLSKSCTITPVLTDDVDHHETSETDHLISASNVVKLNPVSGDLDVPNETTESDSIYPESECDIRLCSQADTENFDAAYRDNSPECQSTPLIAELCHLGVINGSELCQQENYSVNRVLNEMSSSGNSSTSNSPAFLTDNINFLDMIKKDEYERFNECEKCHLSEWLRKNENNADILNGNNKVSSLINLPNTDIMDGTKVIIEEAPTESTSVISTNNNVRNFSYFGSLPTIHEVVDTPTDLTPIAECTDILSEHLPHSLNNNHNMETSSITSPFVYSDSSCDVSTTDYFCTSSPVIPFRQFIAPPPPPRMRNIHRKTPPIPPRPSDEDCVNPIPVPPLPCEAACLPPLPPPPLEISMSESVSLPRTPLVPPHVPTPPQRMYLLIPLAPMFEAHRRTPSPPPAPPRSTSLRRTPPPPPPVIHTFVSDVELTKLAENDDEESRTASSPSDASSVICVSKLTPVQEEAAETVTPEPTLILADSINPSNIAVEPSKSPEQIGPSSLTSFIKETTKCNAVPGDSVHSFSHASSSSPMTPPPPTPPRGKVNVTPPLPPPPKLSFTPDIYLTKQVNNIMSNLEQNSSNGREETTSLESQVPPAPPPFPVTKLDQTISNDEAECRSTSSPVSPLLSVSAYGKLVIDRSDLPLLSPEEEIGRVLQNGLAWGWLQRGVDTLALYTQLRPIIQRGPQCGLVALSMASQLCGSSSSASSAKRPIIYGSQAANNNPSLSPTPLPGVSAAELLEIARQEGFSAHGEMFSADCLARLATIKFGDSVEAVVRKDVLRDKHIFLELILLGALLLVPYDAQSNHQPGKMRGHKAHWGVVSGALVHSRNFAGGSSAISAFARADTRTDNLWHVRRGFHSIGTPSSSRPSSRGPSRTEIRGRSSSPGAGKVAERPDLPVTPTENILSFSAQAALSTFNQIQPENMEVIPLWRQGKSRLLIASKLEDLCESNAQLFEYPRCPDSENPTESGFIIGDMEEGLAGKVVVLHRTTQAVTPLSELLDKLRVE